MASMKDDGKKRPVEKTMASMKDDGKKRSVEKSSKDRKDDKREMKKAPPFVKKGGK